MKNQKINSVRNTKIYVYSCGIGHDNLAERIDFTSFDIVYASQALIDEYLQTYHEKLTICPIGAGAKKDAKNILELAQDNKKILILCSGDALYHGFGGTLIECAKQENLLDFLYECIIFEPNITAFQALFHKLGLAWSKAKLFSVHNFSELPLREILDNYQPLIYGGTKFPAHIIAKEIINYNSEYASKDAVVAEYLGYTNADKKERIVQTTLKEISQDTFAPTSILLLPSNADIMQKTYLPLGLEEEFYQKDRNLITASDARAVILSRLKLPRRGVFWDLGAGSGSVGLEAAALCPNLEVYAVEKNEKRIADIETNKKKLGINNYTVFHSDILAKLQDKSFKKPDRIFIGGGGNDIVKIANLAKTLLNQGGIILISAVTLETFSALYAWKKEQKNASCIKLDMAKESILAENYSSFKQNNTLYIIIYHS